MLKASLLHMVLVAAITASPFLAAHGGAWDGNGNAGNLGVITNKHGHVIFVAENAADRGEALQEAVRAGVDLRNASLQGIVLRDVRLNGANLSGADFTNATLEDVDFSGADLARANFAGATFTHVCVRKANVDGASNIYI